MSKRKKRTDISALVNKYSGLNVVSEIERNLLLTVNNKYQIGDLFLCDLFNENNYELERYSSLKNSLKNDGFLMPLILSKGDNDKYEIINGAKRFLLAKQLGFKEVPCVQAELTFERRNAYILQTMVEENENPLIEEYAFSILKNKYHYLDGDIAEISSLSISQVKNILRLDSLPDFLKDALRKEEIKYSEARVLLNLPLDIQKELYERIKKESISVRELEKEKRNILGVHKKRKVTLHNNKVTIAFKDEKEAEKFYIQFNKSFGE